MTNVLSFNRKGNLFLNISFFVGLIAFVGGWLIFLIWSGARYAGAYDITFLEDLGFFWIFIFFWLCILSILNIIIVTIFNIKTLKWKLLFSLIIILINIPSVIFILDAESEMNSKVFIKLQNNTNEDIKGLQLVSNKDIFNFESLEKESSKVFQYNAFLYELDKYRFPDSLKLIIRMENRTDTVSFPYLGNGQCGRYFIDKNNKIQNL